MDSGGILVILLVALPLTIALAVGYMAFSMIMAMLEPDDNDFWYRLVSIVISLAVAIVVSVLIGVVGYGVLAGLLN